MWQYLRCDLRYKDPHDVPKDATTDRPDGVESTEVDRLTALRGTDESARAGAIVELHRELVWWARRQLGAAAARVDLDPESIVQSVIARESARAVEAATDDHHLWARLRQAVDHKIIDRRRAAQRHAMSPLEDVAARVYAAADSPDGLPRATLGDVIASVASEPARRKILEAILIEGLTCAEVARANASTEEALRAMLTRARPALLRAVIEPLRTFLAADEWRLCQEIVASRRGIAEAGQILGWSDDEVEQHTGDGIVAGLVAVYGPDIVSWLPRVMGRRRI